MPDIPPAALAAASAAIERELMSGTAYDCHVDSEDALARAALDAAAPLLADAVAGRLAEIRKLAETWCRDHHADSQPADEYQYDMAAHDIVAILDGTEEQT